VICTHAAAATNTDADLKGAKISNALGIFPSLSHSDQLLQQNWTSTKSPSSHIHTNTSQAKCPALTNTDAKANTSGKGKIHSPQIQIKKSLEHNQENKRKLLRFMVDFKPKAGRFQTN